MNHWQTTLAILAMLSTLKKEVGGASIEQLKNMPYGEPKSDRKNKAGEDELIRSYRFAILWNAVYETHSRNTK